MKWIDRGNYFELIGKQRDNDWYKAHHARVTASGVLAAMGQSRFKTRGEYLASLRRGYVPQFTEEAKARMKEGELREDDVRKWYEKETGETIEEISMAVPKWNVYIGVSPDGKIVGKKAGIEIKVTDDINRYSALRDYLGYMKHNPQFNDPMKHWFMHETHYAQIQLNLCVFEWEYIDYLVHDYVRDITLDHRVFHNPDYIMNEMLPKTREFIQNYLIPKTETDPDYFRVDPK